MLKRFWVLLLIVCFMTGCSEKQEQSIYYEDEPSELSATESSGDTAESQNDSVEVPNFDGMDVETDGAIEEWPDGLEEAILQIVLQYEEDTVSPDGEHFQSPPDSFVFSKTRNFSCRYSEVMGHYNVDLLSEDEQWLMTITANNFTYEDAEGNVTGGEFVVTDVSFWEK